MNLKEMLSEQVIQDLKTYVAKPYGFVLLYGPNGTGKSYCAMQVYSSLTPLKLPSRNADLAWFINQANLNIEFDECKQIYGSTTYLLEQACKSKLLVLDDIGTRPPSPSFMDFLYAVIDSRWNERQSLGTIVTTNLNSAIMRKVLGEPMCSRIASGRIYKVIGPDRRLTETVF
jgi:DNA replication protein DnaC